MWNSRQYSPLETIQGPIHLVVGTNAYGAAALKSEGRRFDLGNKDKCTRGLPDQDRPGRMLILHCRAYLVFYEIHVVVSIFQRKSMRVTTKSPLYDH